MTGSQTRFIFAPICLPTEQVKSSFAGGRLSRAALIPQQDSGWAGAGGDGS